MNQIYTDLENNFPTEIDNIDKMQDVDILTKKLVDQYYGYINSGDFTTAAQLVENNPSLKASIFNADKFNMIRDMIISMQRFYKDDVRNYLIELIEFKNNYSAATKYGKYDVVLYPNADAVNAYMCMRDDTPKGTVPTNTTYWMPFTYRGQQGTSGAGLSWRGDYSSITQYYTNDCVQHNGIVWCAKKNSLGVEPSSSASDNWGIFMEVTKQIAFSSTQPTGQVENDIWVNTSTGEWKRKNASGSYDALSVMAKNVYDPKNTGIDVTVQPYTHSKSGTIHTLTGSGNNIRFVATNGFNAGDTIKVNGTTCTAKTIGGDALWTGFFKTGAVVMCYKNGNALTFNGGGLPSTEAAKLTPNNIKTGVSVVVNGQQVDGIFTADATASASSIAPGKTAYVNGQKVTGNFTNDASAGGGDIRSGKTAYVKGQKVSGWLASRDTGVPNWIEYVRLANGRFEVAPPAGIHGCYWDGGQYSYLNYDQVRNAIGLTADKIASGQSILGIWGSKRWQTSYPEILKFDLNAPSPHPTPVRTTVSAPASGNYRIQVRYSGHDSDRAGKFNVKIGKNGSWTINEYDDYDLSGTWTQDYYCNAGDQLMIEIGGYSPKASSYVFLYLNGQACI